MNCKECRDTRRIIGNGGFFATCPYCQSEDNLDVKIITSDKPAINTHKKRKIRNYSREVLRV